MDVMNTAISAVKLLKPKRFGDNRGYFEEIYNKEGFAAHGIDCAFVQDSHSYSARKGTVRGLHFQVPPSAQDKLVYCMSGAIFDVALDLRVGSPTFGKHVSYELSRENGFMLFIPKGFAHGFYTLTEHCDVCYKTSFGYSPQHDAGVQWNDPDLEIAWPRDGGELNSSEKDAKLPRLRDFQSPFVYEDAATKAEG